MRDEKYYEMAAAASRHIGSHPGLQEIKRLSRNALNVLDVGCGEGSRLKTMLGSKTNGTGVDTNKYAIGLAKKQYPGLNFAFYKGDNLPFGDGKFRLTYSTFVLEHTTYPQFFLEELIRVTSKVGYIAILCPNYGAPNRRSPVSIESPVYKLIRGFLYDLLVHSVPKLGFTRVTPKRVYKNPDDDTTCEPYILDIIRYFRHRKGVLIESESSLWEIDDSVLSIHQRIFKFFGQKNIYPFKYWGPQAFLILRLDYN